MEAGRGKDKPPPDVHMVTDSEDQAGMDRETAGFATTHWSVVLNARKPEAPEAAQALEVLCRTYYFPLYAYVRRHGHKPSEAEDLTQEFFQRFLVRDALAVVAPEKGKFRSYLLACLKHFLNAARVRDSAIKRGARQTFVPLDDGNVEERYQPQTHADERLEVIYDRDWVTTLMERALAGLREEFQREAKADHFERIKEFLSREPRDGEYAEIQGGLITGAGVIEANVSNGAQLAPGTSAGLLSIIGNYSQTAAGSLLIEIGGPNAQSDYDQLAVSGTASLAGTLVVSLINGYAPNIGDTFRVLTSGSVVSAFDAVDGVDIDAGKRFETTYAADAVTLSVVASP
jgi:RNA polymerase sigma-70 factor (ECF subfamily)